MRFSDSVSLGRLALLAVILLSLLVQPAAAQRLPQPVLLSVFPPGAQVGTSLEVKIVSSESLDGSDRLAFSHPGITAKQVMREPDRYFPAPRPVDHTFIVSVAEDVPPGIYEVRAGGSYGLSNARRFLVDAVPQGLEEETNNTLETANPIDLNTAVYGLAEQSQQDHFRFSAKGGQTLVIDCLAERLDTRGDAKLQLLDAEGRRLAGSQNVVGRDPVICYTFGEDGEYIVRVHELTFGNYRYGENAPYRLTISTRPWVAFADPPVVPRGATSQVTLYGYNLGPGAAETTFDGRRMETLVVTVDAPTDAQPAASIRDAPIAPVMQAVDVFSYRHRTEAGESNPVSLVLSGGPVIAEREPNGHETPHALSLPAELIGRFDEPGDQDWYEFSAAKGEPLWIAVDSQRIGVPSDPLLVVYQVNQNDQGETSLREITSQDDQATPEPRLRTELSSDDPSYLLTVPADGKYRVMVRDLFGSARGGPRFYYRLRIGPPRPDFRLVALPGVQDPANNNQQPQGPQSCILRQGGAEEIFVIAFRRDGFDGPIEVHVPSPPAGLSAPPVIIPPGGRTASLVVRAAADAKPFTAAIEIEGRAEIEGKPQVRQAVAAEILWLLDNRGTISARLSPQIVLSSDETVTLPCRLQPKEEKVWRMALGGKLEVPLELVKQQSDFQGAVTLTAVGLPQNVRMNNATIAAAKPEGKLDLDINTNVPPGRYTIFARGETDMDYRRNPEAADQAKADQERIAKLVQEIAAAYQKAQEQRAQADRSLQQAQQAKGTAEAERNRARQLAAQAAQQAKEIADRAAQAKTAADEAAKKAESAAAKVSEAGDDEAKKAAEAAASQAKQQADQALAAFEAANKQAEESAAKDKEAAKALTQSEKALAEAEAKLKASEEARQKAIEAEQQAKTDVDESNQVKRDIDQRVNTTANIARQQKLKAVIHSDPITIELVPYPVELKLDPPSPVVEAGQQIELAATAQREFSFDGEITYQLQSPVGGLRLVENTKIAKGENGGKLTLAADENTKPGAHETELIIRMQFNNRNLEKREKLTITVKAAPERAKE